MLAPSITIGQLLGHYRIVEKIGGGGQGEVFRAHDERFDRDVALKILPIKALSDDAARKRFRQEAQAVGKLSHPNIATAFYFGEENGVDFLVTEYISGARLDEKLAHGPLPQETVIALGIELASGLEAAHREGIIHRDLKPGNLRVTENGQLKILDFGLAELIDPKIDVAAAETITLTMTLTGTLPYMAPEQFDGISDQRTDLWAAGVVLYELATGQLPFPENQLQRLKQAIKNQEPKAPRELNPAISPGLEAVILRALQKDPKRRYQTAGELRGDLGRVAAGQKVRSNTWLRRHGLHLAAVALLIAVSAYVTHRFWPRPIPPGGDNAYRVLAVLPIEAEGQDASENALVRGVAETVSARIAQGTNGHTLQLIPPNELSAQGVKTAEAARKAFGVDRVLSVALQRSGDNKQMRIICSLIDPKTHQQMDARTVTGDASDLFALEDNTVADVFAMLPANVRLEQPTPSEVHAAEPGAYESYLRGRGYLLDYEKPENIDAAIQQFELALKGSPNYAPAYAGLGEAYWQGYKADRGRSWLDKATLNCQKSLATDPNLAEGHVCLGSIYLDTGRSNDAQAEFQNALAKDSTNLSAMDGLALAYKHLGDMNAAEKVYQQAITVRPHYWAVYNWLGDLYSGQARYAEAAAQFQKVIEIEPDNFRGFNNLGAMQLLEGDYEQSIKTLNRAIALRPTLSAYSNLGAAYFWTHRYPEAIAAFEKARDLDDKDYQNWGNLADALYWSPASRPQASANYKRALQLAKERADINPNDQTAHAYIAEYSAMLGDRAVAIPEIKQALRMAPNDGDIMFRAALVYNQLGDDQQTLLWLRKAVAANFSPTVVRDTPDFARLHSDPEFKGIIDRKNP